MPALQTLVNSMLEEFDRRFGGDTDRSILISSKVRDQLPSHGSTTQLHASRASVAVQATYRGAIVDAVPHDLDWLVAVMPVIIDDEDARAFALYGDSRSGIITEYFDEIDEL